MRKIVLVLSAILVILLMFGGCTAARANNIDSSESPANLTKLTVKKCIYVNSIKDIKTQQTVYENNIPFGGPSSIVLKEGTYIFSLDYSKTENKFSHYNAGQPVYNSVVIRTPKPINQIFSFSSSKDYELNAWVSSSSINFSINEIPKTGGN